MNVRCGVLWCAPRGPPHLDPRAWGPVVLCGRSHAFLPPLFGGLLPRLVLVSWLKQCLTPVSLLVSPLTPHSALSSLAARVAPCAWWSLATLQDLSDLQAPVQVDQQQQQVPQVPQVQQVQQVQPQQVQQPVAPIDDAALSAEAAAAAAADASTQQARVFVGNLSWETRSPSLQEHMERAGEVVRAEVFTEASGRSAGCGIVEYTTAEMAAMAIQTLNDTVLDGRQVFVREDRETSTRRRGMGGGGRGGGGGGGGGDSSHVGVGVGPGGGGGGGGRFRSDRGRKIVVWNLPYSLRWQELKDAFRQCGTVIRADILTQPDGKSKGVGTVLYETEEEAQRAINDMTGREIEGRVIDCRLDRFAT